MSIEKDAFRKAAGAENRGSMNAFGIKGTERIMGLTFTEHPFCTSLELKPHPDWAWYTWPCRWLLKRKWRQDPSNWEVHHRIYQVYDTVFIPYGFLDRARELFEDTSGSQPPSA